MRGRLQRARLRPAIPVLLRGFPSLGWRALRTVPLGALAPSRCEPLADRWAGLDGEASRPQTARRPPARVPRALSVRASEVTDATAGGRFGARFFCCVVHRGDRGRVWGMTQGLIRVFCKRG